jgi:alpha-L-fucosidase 2
VLPARAHSVRWVHDDEHSVYPMTLENQHLQALADKYPDPLLHRVFGAAMEGPGLVSDGDRTLRSEHPMRNGRVDIEVLTEHPATVDGWSADMDRLVARVDAVPLARAWSEHEAWWGRFWVRSWIDVSGDKDANAVTQSYAMQRWMLAAAGRGGAAMKFNGSIFTIGDYTRDGDAVGVVDDPAKGRTDPDFRAWGSNFWFQNERHLYWPMIAAGDLDMAAPFFRMYRDDLPLEKDINELYYHHAGARYPETMYFWGTPSNTYFGLGHKDVVMTNPFIRNHINGGLEVTMMMLDAYAESGDDEFAREVTRMGGW